MARVSLNNKYTPLISSSNRYFVVTGGRGSGKSYSVSSFLTLLSYESGHTILFTRYTMVSASISIIPEFIDKMEAMGIEDDFNITRDEIINKRSGSRIIFKGIKTSSGNQTAALKSIQGVTTWVLDEAEELTDEEVFDKIDLSVREKGLQNRVILILNPTTKSHWIYNRFFHSNGVQGGYNGTKENTTFIHTTYLDNLDNLEDSFIQQIERMKERRPEKYDHQILGGWLSKSEGVIYPHWEYGNFPQGVDTVFGLDFGFSLDPTALVETFIDNSRKRIYLKEHLYSPNLTTSPISDILLSKAKESLIVADSAEPRLISELRNKGSKVVPVKKGAGSIIEGISLIQDYDLIIHKDSTNLAMELDNYSWRVDKVLAVDKFNHLLDAMRYAVTHQLRNPNAGTYAVR